MKISELPDCPNWLSRATTSDANVEWAVNYGERHIVWHDGVWLSGLWRGGVWLSGEWRGGEWRGGEWRGGVWYDGVWRGGVWRGGVWHCGLWRGERITVNPLTIFGLSWPVTIAGTRMQIGCELHTAEDWSSFDDRRINEMDSGALRFWKRYGPSLLQICAERKQMSGE